MPETRRRKKILIKTWISRELLLFFHILKFSLFFSKSSKFFDKEYTLRWKSERHCNLSVISRFEK